MTFVDGLEAPTRSALEAAGRIRRYPRGAMLFAEGDAANDVLIIRQGSVKVVVTAKSGREVVLDVLEAGDLLGELSAVDGGERSATVIALTQVELLVIAATRFAALRDIHADLTDRLLALLVVRLRGAARRQLEFGANDGLGRVCQRLVELARRQGTTGEAAEATLTTPMSQQDLGAWAGLSREAVVKGLAALRRLGWIETEGRRVVIRDLVAVQQRAAL